MIVTKNKIDAFFNKRKKVQTGRVDKIRNAKIRSAIIVKFDQVSKMHLLSQFCILASYKASGAAKPRIVYTSLPKILSRFSTKRKVLKMVKRRMIAAPVQ